MELQSIALPTELPSQKFIYLRYKHILTVPTGIEPAIFAVTGRRDNRYTTGPTDLMIAGAGFEPTTFGL